MLRGGRAMLTVWLFLALLSIGEGTICFEAGPSGGMSTVAEEAGMACVNVTRSSGDPDTFGYRAVADTAADGTDFTPVPAGARRNDRPLRFQPVSFQNSSLTAEVCVTIILDDIACEDLETIFLELNSRGASVCGDNGLDPLFTVQIEDSTRLPVRFTQTEVRVPETDQMAQVVVEAITGDAFIINSADLRLVEDPNESGCLQPGSSETVQFGCNHPGSCSDLGGQQPTVVTVSPSLVGNNDISDCHRFCSLVLERSATTKCKFAFPDGNRLSLVVLDDDDVFVSFSTTLAQVREDNGSLALTLLSTRAASQPFTVHLNSRLLPPGNNTATVDDFTPGPYEVTFPANQTSQVLNIPITDDELLEADTNDFNVLIVNFTSNCSIRSRSPRQVLVQILDEDRVSVDFPSEPLATLAALEDSGELAFILTSTKRSEIGYEVAVRSQQSSGSAAPATDGEDFISATSVVRFAPGNQTSTVALVQLVADSYPEQNETFLLRLTQPPGRETSGMLYNRFDLPEIPTTATILNDDPPHEVCFVQPEYRVKEDDGGVDVSVRLNGTTARANITIRISARSTGNGETDASVTPGDDILEAEWVVTILAGENETTFEISVIADDLAEADEMFELELTVLEEPYFAVPCATESTATVVIVDDDPVMIDVTAVDSRVEGEHQVYEVTFSTQTPFVIPFDITVRPTNGTATGGEDFVSDPITLSFNENRTSVTANIPIINDAIAEDPETFLVIAEPGSSSLTIDINQADSSLMILDNEAIHYFDSVMLTIARNESDGSVPVTVNRRGYIQRESTVLIQPVIGSPPNAAGSGDFTIDPVTVTFAAGEGSVTAAVPLTQDMISELEEQFLLRLIERTSIGGALVEDLVVPPNEATVLIRDPGDVVCVSFSRATYTVPEDIGAVEIAVEADKDFTFPFQVEVSLSPNTAQLGTDYLPESFNVTFEPGSRTATGSIGIVNDDILEMKTETALMVLSPSEGNVKDVCVATPGTATLGIIDDDNMTMYFEMALYTVSEGSNISICILANISSDIPVVVMVTSQQMIDFALEASIVTFAPGETRKCIQFSALSDDVKENTERIPLTIMLMEQEGVSVGDPGETVVNIIDTTGLSIEFEQAYYPVTEGASTVVNVVLSNQYTTAFLVRIVPERMGDINFNGFLQFTPPLISRSIRVDALADNVAEEMENITLSIDLSLPETQRFGVVLGSQSTTVIGVESTEVIVVTFALPLYRIVEGQMAEVQLNSTLPAETVYTIQVVQVDGHEDFEVLNDGTATFPNGSQMATVQIRALTDEIQEPDEVFTIEARLTDSSASLGVVIGGDGQADVVVEDMTAAVTVGFDPTTYSVTEGGSVDITLRASSNFSVPFNVTLTSDGDEDITLRSSVVTFQPSSRTVSVTLDALTDDIQEPPEIVTLDFEISATIDVSKGSNSQATVTVIDNSPREFIPSAKLMLPSITVNFQQDAYSVIEGATVEIVLVANRTSSVPFAVTITPDTQGDGDYEFVSNSTVTFLPGALASSVRLRALDDAVKEPDETYSFSLSVADSGGVDVIVGAPSSAQVTITDPTSISISFEEANYQLIEGGDVRVTLIANGTSILPFTVNITTTPGSAQETDYDSGPYQVRFNSEESSASALIRSRPDECAEQQENFTLNIQLSVELQNMNIHLGVQDEATVELSDPTVLRVSFNQSSYQTDEGSSFATAVVASVCYEGNFDVEISTMDLTATAGEDYLPPSTLLQFRNETNQPGEEILPLSISTVNDNIPEPTEEFQAGLSISSSDMGLNVTADGSLVSFTIIDDDEEPSIVSFSSSQYSTSEGDTLVVGFAVTPSTRTVTGTVTVTVSNGTARSPFDFSFTTATVNPVTDTISIPILSDDVVEMEETFGLELTISAGMDLQLGNISQATVSITDVNLITVNDTVTADPVFAVPINVMEPNPTGLNPGELSLCYEIHGDEDKWFNFISDKCLSLNAYYKLGQVFNRMGHVIRELGILSEDDNRLCRQVLAVMNDDGECSVMVDGNEVNVSNSGGLRVNKNRNRIRVSVPNCDNHRVVIWASCEDFFGNQIMRLVVTRGLNLRPTSHGFLGQFWNIDVALEKFNETADELLKQKEGSFPHYIVHLRPPAPTQARSFVGELYSTKWDNTPEPCIYVGSNQAGTGRSDLPPLGTIVEGAYDDYIVRGAFDYNYQFTRFESESCRPDPVMEA